MNRASMKWGAGASLVGASLLALSALTMSPASGQGPPGNNGTVKIDGVEFDSHPDNEPHVGCTFQVDFTGFDAAQPEHVEFALQRPTGTASLLTDDVTVDANGDGSRTYDLAAALEASNATPQANQGFHIKLTITSDDIPGNGTKHKVFWVKCQVPTTTTTSTTVPRSTTTTTAPAGAVPPGQARPGGQAPARGVPQAPTAGAVPSGQLAFTGSSTSILAGVGFALLLGGAALSFVARRRLAT